MGDVKTVSAIGATIAYPELATVGDIDNAIASLTFVSGKLGVVDLTRSGIYGYDISTEILGLEGTIRIGYLRETPIMVMTKANGVSHDTVPYFMERFRDAYPNQLQNFAQNVLHDRPAPITIDDGMEALRIGVAATRARETGVTLPFRRQKLKSSRAAVRSILCDSAPQIRPVAHRLPARRRRAHRALQLALCAPPWRHVHPAHRRHRRRALAGRNGHRHSRRPAVAGHRLGRGSGDRRPARAVFSVTAARSLSRGREAAARQRPGVRGRRRDPLQGAAGQDARSPTACTDRSSSTTSTSKAS